MKKVISLLTKIYLQLEAECEHKKQNSRITFDTKANKKKGREFFVAIADISVACSS